MTPSIKRGEVRCVGLKQSCMISQLWMIDSRLGWEESWGYQISWVWRARGDRGDMKLVCDQITPPPPPWLACPGDIAVYIYDRGPAVFEQVSLGLDRTGAALGRPSLFKYRL